MLFWAYRKSRPLSRWSIIGIEENKINLSSEISWDWEEIFTFTDALEVGTKMRTC